MKVILLEKIDKLGEKGEVKNVSSGYARNFLFAKELAEPATTKKLESVIKKTKKDDKIKVKEGQKLRNNIEKITKKEFIIKTKANKEGHLFAAVHENDIIKVIEKETGVKLKKDNIKIEKALKQLGISKIEIVIDEMKAMAKLNIKSL